MSKKYAVFGLVNINTPFVMCVRGRQRRIDCMRLPPGDATTGNVMYKVDVCRDKSVMNSMKVAGASFSLNVSSTANSHATHGRQDAAPILKAV